MWKNTTHFVLIGIFIFLMTNLENKNDPSIKHRNTVLEV